MGVIGRASRRAAEMLGLTLVVLYVSLKFLDGSVYALAAGLAMGVFALSFEGLRLVRAWTV